MNKGDAYHMAAFQAYLVDGRNLAQKEVLLDLAEFAALTRLEAEAVLADRTFKSAVDRDWAEAKRLNIKAVPTVIFNGNRIVGFQPYEKIARQIKKALPSF